MIELELNQIRKYLEKIKASYKKEDYERFLRTLSLMCTARLSSDIAEIESKPKKRKKGVDTYV